MFRCDRGDYLVCHTTLCTRGCGCSGHPAFPTPSRGREINARLGRIAPRGANVCQKTMRLFENEVGICAKRSLRSLLQTRSSCPDLIRASINLRNKSFRRRWITGSSSAKTRFALSPGDDDLNRYDGQDSIFRQRPTLSHKGRGSAIAETLRNPSIIGMRL